MSDHIEQLKKLEKRKDFFIGIDSDGCAFDTMEIKHKECFIPNIVNSWDLQPVSRFVRRAAEFVNLYSVHRGCNRFIALELVFDLLGDWNEPVQRGYKVPEIDSLRQWIKDETRLSNFTLEAKMTETKDPVLKRALDWSAAVNETIERIVHNIPPFPYIRESLEKIFGKADIMVVSATPIEALHREWEEQSLVKFVRMICGQEMGSKKEHLKYGACGKYEPDRILMIGDAPGDMRAARENGVCFYPINPGAEAKSWKRFYEEAADKFLTGEYVGEYEDKVTHEFLGYLPSTPPWKNAIKSSKLI